MSVTVRLSKRLSDVLGEDAATELTEYLNAMDLAYRTQLQSLNEFNLARLRAELHHETAALRYEMAEFKAEVRREIANLKQEMAEFKAEVCGEINNLRQEMATLRTEMHQEIRGLQGTLLPWIFGLWITTMLAMWWR